MGTPAPDSVKRLVDLFDRERKVYQSAEYKEEQLRAEFLNPFFESLGWDVANKAGLTEVFKPVIHEESIKVAGATKAPDYTFRIGGRRHRTWLGTRTPLTFGLYAVTFRLYCEVNYGHN